MDLCEACAPRVDKTGKKLIDPTGANLSNVPDPIKDLINFFGSLLKGVPPDVQELTKPPVEPKKLPACPGCGFTVLEIANTSKLGCGQCYEFFKEELNPVLTQLHKNIKHVGKKPKPKLKLGDLEKQLREAIKIEDYEAAAKIRDSIKNFKDESVL